MPGNVYPPPGIVIRKVKPTVVILPQAGSRVYTELWPGPNERWKVFINSFPPGSELGAGATVRLIDIETNLPTPYDSPVGWYARYAEWMGSFDQAVRLTSTMDANPPFILYLPVQFDTHEYERIAFFDSRYWDPEAKSAHTWDFAVTNVSASPTIGSVQVALILERAGSPEMTHKTVRCPQCGGDTRVPIDWTSIRCGSCGFDFKVPYYGKGVI